MPLLNAFFGLIYSCAPKKVRIPRPSSLRRIMQYEPCCNADVMVLNTYSVRGYSDMRRDVKTKTECSARSPCRTGGPDIAIIVSQR